MLTIFLPCTFSILFNTFQSRSCNISKKTKNFKCWTVGGRRPPPLLLPPPPVSRTAVPTRWTECIPTGNKHCSCEAWFCFGYLTDSSHFVHFFDFFVLGCFTLVVLLWLFYFAVLCCAWLSIDMGHFTLAHSLQHHAKHRRRGPGSCHTVHECQ